MRKIWIIAGVLLLVLAAGGMMLMAKRAEPQWGTASPEAVAAFERGLDAQMKYYGRDAHEAFSEALELDPDFAAARIGLLRWEHDGDRRAELIAELRELDPDRLSAREGFLVRYTLARQDGDEETADRILREYLARNPDDPFALATCSSQAWDDGDWERAESHYRRLLEADPNWVSAQNRLGYMAMAQGRFKEAEELFETYHFIAPDQANPHDSMGELLTVLGRYDEARQSLERALEIKPDFCGSYEHLFTVATLAGRPEEYEEIVRRAGEHCGDGMAEILGCVSELWADYLSGNYEGPWGEDRDRCRKAYSREFFLMHRLAVLSGKTGAARKLEAQLSRSVEKGGPGGFEADIPRALLLHMRGVRILAAGEFEEAASILEEADELLLYWGQGHAILKMFNQMNLAAALEGAGRAKQAERVVESVRRVNPDFARVYLHIREEFLPA